MGWERHVATRKSGWLVAAFQAATDAYSATLTNRNSASAPRLRCSAVER
jgi:hypothetical protein